MLTLGIQPEELSKDELININKANWFDEKDECPGKSPQQKLHVKGALRDVKVQRIKYWKLIQS